MENKEIEKEIVKILDKITDYKVPCDCPKGGIIEMMDGNHSYTCPKCDGSEWVVNPKLVKELLALHPQQPLERIPEETRPTGRKSYGYSITKIRMAISKIFKDRNIEEGDWIVTDLCHLIAKEKHKSFNDGEEYAKEKVEVEPLQNGKREVEKVKEQLRRKLPVGAYADLYEEVTDNKEERILGYVTCGERVLDDYAKVIVDLLSQSKKEGRLELLTKLNSLYGEYEGNVPEPSISKYDNEYNSGMYTGKLKAMEDVCQKVFDTNGDEIKSLVG